MPFSVMTQSRWDMQGDPLIGTPSFFLPYHPLHDATIEVRVPSIL